MLFTAPNHEVRVAENLKQRGFDVYLPSTLERNTRTKASYARPIFSRYLFCRFDYAERWRILMMPGLSPIHGIVQFDNKPATLSDSEIGQVRELEAQLRAPRPPQKRGDVVSIQVGRLTLTGPLVRQDRKGRDVIVLQRAA